MVLILDDDQEEIYKTAANILIDEFIENHTWKDTVEQYEWCSGNGTLKDPYIIQQVYIDGQFLGKTYLFYAPILIRNSEAYFIIQNCTMIRAGDSNHNAGVRLENVTNGAIDKGIYVYRHKGVAIMVTFVSQYIICLK